MRALEVRPIARAVGAEVYGVDLSKPLALETFAQVEPALHDPMVLLFRGQDITPDQQLDFGRAWGDPYWPAMSAFPLDHPEVMLLDTTTRKGAGADNWHYDATFMETPPLEAVLRPVPLPSQGGDPCFAKMVAAYDALSPTLRSMLEGMQAVHDLTPQLRIAVERGISPDQFETLQQQWPPVVPPPPLRASRRSSSTEIRGAASQGLTNQENALLLPFLLDPVRSPEFECRVHWELDCVRMWDNRCVQHCGVPDFSERRIMHRVTIAGDRPR